MSARPLCPTERLLRLLRLEAKHVVSLTFVLLPVLTLMYQYGVLDQRNTVVYVVGFVAAANLVFGFKYYGDRIYRAAMVVEDVGVR